MADHWSAEDNANYKPCSWVLRYDPTPGGKKNPDGSKSFSMNFPALQLTDWVGEPEKIAPKLAVTLNLHDPLVEALKGLVAVAVWDEETDRDAFDAAIVAAKDALAKAELAA